MTMRSLTRRAVATAAVALLAGAGLAGCSAGESGPDTAPQSQTQSAAPSPAESAPAESTSPAGTMSIDDFAQRIGDAQLKAGSASFTQTIETAGQTIETSGALTMDSDPSKMRMAMTLPEGMEMRIVDGVIYMNMGPITDGKFYMASLDGDDPIAQQMASSVEQANPAAQLESLKAALLDFRADENAETIDGVTTTRYTLVLDTQKMLAEVPQEIPQEAIDQMGDRIEYEMYVGPDDLPRRLVMNMGPTATTMEFSDWGAPVSVEAPPADQVTDQLGG
ncbi:hypothetical protein AOA12_06735 [Microbacterium sp. No. 7]|nr:hypothetical protein AOA12_06735 [Microbacterium sp. No. 7]